MAEEKINVLIVDDIKENHLVMESVLSDPKLNLIKALSGEEALTLCMTHSFAVILMDVQMPGMDGFETAEMLRSIEKTKYTPIIFVTAISKEKTSLFKGYEIGAVDYLFKPIDPLVLKSKVRIFKDLYFQKRLIEEQALELEYRIKELTEVKEEKRHLEDLSMHDQLTTLLNRRGIDKRLDMHWRNCSRYSLPISVVMIDIDNFKKYNDNYGHLQGDEVLKSISHAMDKTLLRPEDIVGRFGGEEFLAVLPNTDLEGAKNVADRILESVYDLNILHEYNEDFGRVTISLGLATTMPYYQDSSSDLVEQADQQLYISKNKGRNQVSLIEISKD